MSGCRTSRGSVITAGGWNGLKQDYPEWDVMLGIEDILHESHDYNAEHWLAASGD